MGPQKVKYFLVYDRGKDPNPTQTLSDFTT